MKNLHTIPQKKSSPGFTIIELLIVLVVISILVLIVTTGYSAVKRQANVALLQGDLVQGGKQLNVFRVKHSGVYPTTLSEVNNGDGFSSSDRTTLYYEQHNELDPSDYCLSSEVEGIVFHITRHSEATEGPCPAS